VEAQAFRPAKTRRREAPSFALFLSQHVFDFLDFRTHLVPESEPSMTGKAYYLTTLADWQRHAARFANSHFIVLTAPDDPGSPCGVRELAPALSVSANSQPAGDVPRLSPGEHGSSTSGQARPADSGGEPPHSTNDSPRILVLIEADEGVHLSLDDDPAFEALPHPLAQKSISPVAQSVLAPHGVAPGATTFDAAEALARVHPLLRHRVF
jgi:hypothetical protein